MFLATDFRRSILRFVFHGYVSYMCLYFHCTSVLGQTHTHIHMHKHTQKHKYKQTYTSTNSHAHTHKHTRAHMNPKAHAHANANKEAIELLKKIKLCMNGRGSPLAEDQREAGESGEIPPRKREASLCRGGGGFAGEKGSSRRSKIATDLRRMSVNVSMNARVCVCANVFI